MRQDFVQQIYNTIHEVVNEIHTAMPGKIVEYSGGMASVKPSLRFKTPKGEYLPYPVIANVPVVVTRGKNAAIAVPIKAGDDCLIIISEQAIDEWASGAEDDTQLKFDLTNAICIPGLSSASMEAQEEANSTDSVVIACGNNKICVSDESIVVWGDVKVEGNLTYTGEIEKL